METGSEIQGPLHIVRCIGDLALMYWRNEVVRPVLDRLDSAMDVFPEDD